MPAPWCPSAWRKPAGPASPLPWYATRPTEWNARARRPSPYPRGADSADFALVNRVQSGDVVVTQDYGLAAMCLARRARVLHQDGHEYTPENIDGLLAFRHEARKLRRAGGRTRGPAKRTPAQDEAFRALLARVLAGEK